MELYKLPEKSVDKEIYDYIFRRCKMGMEYQPQQPQSMSIYNHGYMVLHVLLKLLITIQFEFEDFFDSFTNSILTTQVMVTLIIVDFWFTKNVLGRGLIGLRWFFGEDENGVERFMYEARINKQYVNVGYRRLFWVIQGIYLLFAYLDFTALFAIEANIYHVSSVKIVVCAGKIAGGMSNLYMFYKVNKDAEQKRQKMKDQLGNETIRKLGTNSFVVCF